MAESLKEPLLYSQEFKGNGIDLERLPMEEVFELLKSSQNGLSTQDAQVRLMIFGLTKLEEKPENQFLKFLSFMWNPLSWVMEVAAVMALILANGGVIRDGNWQDQDEAILVPGDIISIKLGDIIPADARLLEGYPLKIEQSALTGESLPVTKKSGDEVFLGSICKHGEIEAVVIATGVHSFLGKAAYLVNNTEVVGHILQKFSNFKHKSCCKFNSCRKRGPKRLVSKLLSVLLTVRRACLEWGIY